MEFVRTRDTEFATGDERFAAVGVNCYFLAYCGDASRRAVLDAAVDLGATVVRAWAFLDVAERAPGQVAFQTLRDGEIARDGGADGLERLDALIADAEARGLRLILPLVNHWKDFGGMPQYLRWLEIDGGVEEFYRALAARAAYRDWMEFVLTRENTRTGRMYRDEPSILAWELANEPRCAVRGGRELLLDWIAEMSSWAKALDGNHLLAAGDEGFFRERGNRDALYDGRYGVDAEAILNIEEIDFGTYHWYPSASEHEPDFGDRWVADHVELGRRVNKPVVMEEYGWEAAAERNQWYARWLETVQSAGGAGDLLWMLGGRDAEVAGFRDAYTVYDGAEVPALAAHAAAMRGIT